MLGQRLAEDTDTVKCNILIQILNETDIDWCEKRFISEFYVHRSDCLYMTAPKEKTKFMKTAKGGMLLVTDSIQFIKRIPFQRSS